MLPDTTYLERWDCISLLDRPIGSPEGPADAIRQPVIPPDRDVRPFQDVLIELGVRLKLPGFAKEDGSRGVSRLRRLHRQPRAPPRARSARRAGAARDGTAEGVGAANPDQLQRYVANGCFWTYHHKPEALYYKHANAAYLADAKRLGLIDGTAQIVLQLYSEPLQKFRLAAEGHGPNQPPDSQRARIRQYFDPLPIWYPPFEQALPEQAAYPLHAITQRPMAMYHAWHSQNAWLRQIYSYNRLYMHRGTAAALGIADDGWVWAISRHGRVKCQVKLMEGVNPDTVWTWNAIGKRRGAWNLSARRAGIRARLPAESGDFRVPRWRAATERRPGDGAGSVVRPARAGGKGGWPGNDRTAPGRAASSSRHEGRAAEAALCRPRRSGGEADKRDTPFP